jgi:exonuclease SbcC
VILKRVVVDGFGKLVNRGPFDFSPGLTVIAGPNESGKSTLAECIIRLLFGYPRQQFSEELDRFRPWASGAPYRAHLEYALDDRRAFETTRDFASDAETVTRTLDTKERVDGLSGGRKASPGHNALSLSLEAYRAAAVIRAGELQTDGDPGIKALAERLAAVVGSAGDEGADAASAALRIFASKDIGSPQSTTTPFAIARREREAAERAREQASAAFHSLKLTIEGRATAMAEVDQLAASRRKAEFAVNATRLRALQERSREVDAALAALADAEAARSVVGGDRARPAGDSRPPADDVERAVAAREVAAAQAASAFERIGDRTSERTDVPALRSECDTAITAAEQRAAQVRTLMQAAAAGASDGDDIDRAAVERLEMQDIAVDAAESRARNAETRAAIARQLSPSSPMAFAPVLLIGVLVLVTGLIQQAPLLIRGGAGALAVGLVLLLFYLSSAGKRAERIRAAEAYAEDASEALDSAQGELAAACRAFGCDSVAAARARFNTQRDRAALRAEAAALADTLESRRAQRRVLDAQLAGFESLDRDLVARRSAADAATATLAKLLDDAGVAPGADLDARIASFRDLRGATETAARADTAVAEADAALSKALGSFDVESLHLEIERLSAVLRDAPVTAPLLAAAVDEQTALAGWNDLRRRLTDAEIRLAELTAVYNAAKLPDIAALEEHAAACRAEEERLASAARSALLARDVIDEVKIAVHKSFLPTMNAALGAALSAITAGKYVEAHLNPADFAVRLASSERGGTVDPWQLSSGTLEQVNLALRAATAQALGSGERVPLILDDALAHADPQRAAGALRLLAEAGDRGIQALFFTQRSDLVALARELPGVRTLHLELEQSTNAPESENAGVDDGETETAGVSRPAG